MHHCHLELELELERERELELVWVLAGSLVLRVPALLLSRLRRSYERKIS